MNNFYNESLLLIINPTIITQSPTTLAEENIVLKITYCTQIKQS